MPSMRHGAKAHRWGTGVALAIPLWVDSVPGMQGWSPELVALAYAAAAEWSAPDVPVRFVRANGSDGALVRVHWHWDAPWPGRGVTRRTVDVRGETTGADCWIALSAQPATPHAVRVAVLHELGHALGLPHDPAPRSVMYDGHRIGADPAALTSRDRAALRALYGPPAGAVESLASGASVPTGSPRR